jgi:5-formyltetrahydrofolate cyclo-ligase
MPLLGFSVRQETYSRNTKAKGHGFPGKKGFSSILNKGIFLASLFSVQPDAHAENTDSPYLKLGKIDTFYDRKDNGDFQVNSFLWSPVFKGGYGIVAPENGGQDTHYFGGYVRPLLTHPELGDVFLGAQEVLVGDSSQTEVQGEYRLPSGLGFGGGFVDREFSDQDIQFARVSYKNEWQGIRYILSTQWQNFQGQDYPGGYIALYNKALMASWGSDGEQWRSSFGYVAPDQGQLLRPALEVLYIDNTIGKVDGSKDLMISGSLGFRNGFLSHEARLGRAMGPTGMEFTNPVAHLNPTFNRRLNTWELGELVDFRYINKALPNGRREETLEAVVFPGQLLRNDSLLSSIFVGAGVTSPNPGEDGVSGLLGYAARIKHLGSNVRVQHDFDRDDTSLYFGLIYWI